MGENAPQHEDYEHDPGEAWEEILRSTIRKARERHGTYSDLLIHLRHRWQEAITDKEKGWIHERIRRAIRILEEEENLIAAVKSDIKDILNERQERPSL